MEIVLLENLGCSPELIEENVKKLKALGHEFKAFQKSGDEEKLKDQVKNADVIMLANMPLPAAVIDAAPNLKFIDVAFTGVDHIPVKKAKDRDIAISNASGYADQAVAELCISFMIQLLRDLNKAQKTVKTGGTKAGLRANLLQGKTIGILGAGAIGKRLAALAKAFGATIIAHNRHEVKDPNIDRNVSLDELLRHSDIISIHTPLTEQTKGMIGKNELAKMKKSAFIVNTGRGPVIETAALVEALNNGQIAGAAIDVFDQEPPLPEDMPLLHAPNIIVTPHLGFYSEESLNDRARIVFDNLFSWLEGKQINKI